MKKALTIFGYLASLFLVSTIAFKVNSYPGEEIVMIIAGILISIYFPIYILEKGRAVNNGKPLAVNYALAITVFFVTLGATLKLTHLELGSLAMLLGLGSFCLVYSPLLYIKKSKEPGANRLMYAAGILGVASFPLGIFFRVYLGTALGMQMFTVGAILLFLFYLPFYSFDKSLSPEERQKRTETTFYTIIIGFLLFFCIFKGIYPPKIETQNQQTNQQINTDH